MKKVTLFFFVALLSVMAYGQAGTQTFAISAGAMFPLGDLADNNLADSSSGVAATGYHVQVSYDYQFSDNFGLGVDVEFNSAKYSMSKINKYYEDLLDDTGKKYLITSNWSIGGIYLRYFFRLPLGSKVSWEAAPLVGAMGAYSPEYQITKTSIIPSNPNPSCTYYRQWSKAFSFAYGGETKFNFKTDHHSFFFEGRIIASKANFKHVTGTGCDGNPYDYPIKMNLIYISANVGYTYYF